MPNKQRTNVRKSASVDARTRRTTTALAHALIQIIGEGNGRFEDITVRQILQRAGVGRTAFYSHCLIRDLNLSTMVQPTLAARMLAAALIESMDWWFDHESIAAAEIDTAFHLLAQTVMADRRPRRH
jgi:hypothetical protein